MLQRVVHWKPSLKFLKGKRGSGNDNLGAGFKSFNIYFGPKDYSVSINSDNFQELLGSARNILLESKNGLQHLATMTFGEHSPTKENLMDRIDKITTYLQSYPPDVRLEATHFYGETPDPTSTLRYYNLHDTTPWQAMSIQARQNLPLEFSLNTDICELIQKSSTGESRSLICFFLKIVVIHELAHVVMYAFASQDTPKKFRGSKPLKANATRGEAGDSLEGVMIGGEVSLAIPSHSTIQTTDPSDIIVVIRMSSGNNWKVLDVNTSSLTDIASGNWSHINAVPTQPELPPGFSHTKLKFSDAIEPPSPSVPPSPPVPPSSSYDIGNYVVWEPQSDPSINVPGVKR